MWSESTYTLLRANVWENDQHIALPLDKGSSVESISTLLQHWQAFLNTPLLNATLQNHTETMIDLTRRLINQQLLGIAAHERMISYYNRRIQQVQDGTSSQRRADSMNQDNQSNLIKHQQHMNKLQGFLERSIERLHQLSA